MIPVTRNPQWGFWGAWRNEALDLNVAWAAACDALMAAFDVTPEQARRLLDARFGRLLADDLSYVSAGTLSAEAIERHIMARLADPRWRKWFESAARQAQAAGDEKD